jgi:hypothetical protein
MSLHFIGQRLRVSRGGCWQCGSDCRSHLAEVLTFSQMAYNGPQVVGRFQCRQPAVIGWPAPSETLGKCGNVQIVLLLFGDPVLITLYLECQTETPPTK